MNEFLVLDENSNKVIGEEFFNSSLNNGFSWIDYRELKENETKGDLILHSDCSTPSVIEGTGFGILKRFPYLRFKDIYNNKIYLEHSIIEFDKESGGHTESLKGYFTESSPMIFQLVILDNPYWNILYWHEWRHQLKNFKIIDTIQENKLGLIK